MKLSSVPTYRHVIQDVWQYKAVSVLVKLASVMQDQVPANTTPICRVDIREEYSVSLKSLYQTDDTRRVAYVIYMFTRFFFLACADDVSVLMFNYFLRRTNCIYNENW